MVKSAGFNDEPRRKTEPGARRGPYQNGIATRQQIVKAAIALFARRGYAGASLREIAREVGLTPRALSRHFAGKQELLIAVLQEWERVTMSIVGHFNAHNGLEYFSGFMPLMRYHVAHPGLIELFLTICAEVSDPKHIAYEWARSRYDLRLATTGQQLRFAEEHDHIRPMSPQQRDSEARRLFALMDGLELQWIVQPELDLTAAFEAAFTRTLRRWGAPVSVTRLPESSGASEPAPASAPDLGRDTPGPRGPYQNGIQRRAQILTAASAIFARHGYAGSSLADIAGRVGVTGAAILRHFGSKEGLLLAVLDEWDAANHAAGTPFGTPTKGGYLDTLPGMMRNHLDNPGIIELFLTICTESSDPDHPARQWTADRYRRIVARASDAFAAAGDSGLIRQMSEAEREFESRCIYAAMDGLELQWLLDPGIDLVGLFRDYFENAVASWQAPEPAA